MRKKALIEQLAALKKKRREETDRLTGLSASGQTVTPEDLTALQAQDAPIEALETEIAGIETLEAAARARTAEQAAAAPGQQRQPATAHNLAEDRPFAGLGDYLRSVALSSTPGNAIDPRLQTLAPSGSSNIVPSDGFPTPVEIAQLVYNRGFELASVAKRCRRMTLTNAAKLSIPIVKETSRATGSRWGGVQVYRRNEGDTVTATKPQFDFLEIQPESMMGLMYVTSEMLEDQGAIEGVARQAFGEEIAFKMDDESINGNGAAQFLGILNCPALVSIAKETGQAAATLTYENIVKMYTRMPSRLRRNAVWLVNQDIEPQLWTMSFPIGTGGVPVFLPPGGASVEPYSRLFGREVIPIEQCATLGTKGDILFVNLDEYLIVEKGGIKADSSMHVRFIYNEMAFRWVARNNGQPTWKSAVTPFKGSASVSPFISLDTRA